MNDSEESGKSLAWSDYVADVKRCSRCIMPEIKGVLSLDDVGLCPECAAEGDECGEHQTTGFQSKSPEDREKILKRKIERYRSSGPYDCAVAVSGGKDSLGAWYMARKMGLKTLGIFIDNGFALPEMYENVQNASTALQSDVIVFRTTEPIRLFEVFLRSNQPIYYCRVCHLLLDVYIRKVAKSNNIRLVLGGYTKGQSYLSQERLKWIFDESDRNALETLKGFEEFAEVHQIISDPVKYSFERFRDVMEISPFKYLDYDEDELRRIVETELGGTSAIDSWPGGSTNCLFNYVSQYLATRQFGYSQHETELSDLVRRGELSRDRALRAIETPILRENLEAALGLYPDLTASYLESEPKSLVPISTPIPGRRTVHGGFEYGNRAAEQEGR